MTREEATKILVRNGFLVDLDETRWMIKYGSITLCELHGTTHVQKIADVPVDSDSLLPTVHEIAKRFEGHYQKLLNDAREAVAKSHPFLLK